MHNVLIYYYNLIGIIIYFSITYPRVWDSLDKKQKHKIVCSLIVPTTY